MDARISRLASRTLNSSLINNSSVAHTLVLSNVISMFSFQNERRKSEATSALTVFRGEAYDPSEELAQMQREAEQAASKKSSIFDLVRTRASRMALLASFGGMFFQQMSGVNAVIFYTTPIFQASGSSMPAEIASIIVAIVQVCLLTLFTYWEAFY